VRDIQFLRGRHVPDSADCGATIQMGDDHVRCQGSAVLMVRIDGKEDYVCHDHLTLLCKEKWPVKYKEGTV
jgi:hypothetical protein